MFLVVMMVGILALTADVLAEAKNEVTLNFKGGIVRDGYVEYDKVAKLQLFKDDVLVNDITDMMVIDLNEAAYKFVIQDISSGETGNISGNVSVKLNINGWYYPINEATGSGTDSTFKLETSEFSGTLAIKLERKGVVVNTKVENVYDDISIKKKIDLTEGKEFVIDFAKSDELTEALKLFADLEKTLYYKKVNDGLELTDSESEAVIKIVGNKDENKAILTAVNVGTKKSEVFKGLHTKYTGSKLNFDGAAGSILNEIRTDYYTRCKYEFNFQYVNEEVSPKEYKFTEGANQIYVIDESKNAIFRIDADFSLFDGKVYIDDALLDAKNYQAESGSTIIILNKEYVDTLSVGEHTIKVEFSDSGSATTKFEAKVKQVNTEKLENITNPQTGDNIGTYIVLSIVSVLGIAATMMINKKKREN